MGIIRSYRTRQVQFLTKGYLMTAATITAPERDSATEPKNDTHSSKQEREVTLSQEVWALAKGLFDGGIAKPAESVLEPSAASLYKSVMGAELPHLSGSIEQFDTAAEKFFYATG